MGSQCVDPRIVMLTVSETVTKLDILQVVTRKVVSIGN